MDSLAGFGRRNKQTLGELLFSFFRYYGHELDYEKYVVSVREGRLLSKVSKGWHLLQNNRLCVEEPFNTSRNLGNTADDTSVRGLHIELRRAFKTLSEGSLDECCAQYEYPAEEERSWERHSHHPRPIITAVPPYSSRGGRGGGRGGRHPGQFTRAGYPGRRTSNPVGKPNNLRHPVVPANSDVSAQAQHAQYLLHDHLYQQIQILQAQEQELRLQLHNQALMTGRPSMLVRQPFIQFPMPQQESANDENSRARSGTVNHPPVNTSSRQPVYYSPAYFPVSLPGAQNNSSTTNPPSPSAAAAPPDSRRNPRRSSVANGSPGGSLRAHSQPARPLHSQHIQGFVPLYTVPQSVDSPQESKHHPVPGSPPEASQGEDENPFMSNSLPNGSRPACMDESRPSEYIGYYLGSSPQLQAYHPNTMMTPVPAPVGLALQNGYYYPVCGHPQDYRPATLSSNEALGSPLEPSSAPNDKPAPSQKRPAQAGDRGPLIVDGSVPLSDQRNVSNEETYDQYANMGHYASSSDDHNHDMSASGSDSFSQDLHDSSSSMEADSAFFARQPLEIHKPNNYSEGRVNGQNGRVGLLSTRLQNLHFSNSERLTERPSSAGSDRVKTANTCHEAADKDTARPRQVTSTTEKIPSAPGIPSKIAESHVQPSNGRRRTNGVEAEKANGSGHHVHHKAKPRGRHEPTNISTAQVDGKERRSDHPPRKQSGVNSTNGAYGSGTTHTTGGWQTTKKKHKRNAKSLVDSRHAVNAGAEPLPADESLRKGG